MYKIGEFSKITNLTIKALHYYEKEEILFPTSRGDNNYRIYNEDDIKKAHIIVLLKEYGFTINEIKDVIKNFSFQDNITYILEEKKKELENKILSQKKMLEKINTKISQYTNEEEIKMNHNVVEKTIPRVTVLSVCFKGHYSDVGKYVGDLYKEAKSSVAGQLFNLYYDEGYEEEAEIELCLPIKNKIQSTKYTVKEIPETKCISVIHEGAYDKINSAYKAIIDYSKEHNLELDIPSRLIYHKGPGMIFKGNPNKYITEVLVPIKK